MEVIILVVHLMVAIALVISVLLQRSEGGGLGIGGGGGGGGGGFLTGRATANLLTRTTAVLAACFMATSITLAIMAGATRESRSVVGGGGAGATASGSTAGATGGAGATTPQVPVAPKSEE